MNVICEKGGYETGSVSVEETLAGATFANIILGGGIGILVDAATGAAQHYPDKIVVWMRPLEWASSDEETDWYREKRKFEEAVLAKQQQEQSAGASVSTGATPQTKNQTPKPPTATASTPSRQPSCASKSSIEGRLSKLKQLYEKKLITEEEYDAKRKAIVEDY